LDLSQGGGGKKSWRGVLKGRPWEEITQGKSTGECPRKKYKAVRKSSKWTLRKKGLEGNLFGRSDKKGGKATRGGGKTTSQKKRLTKEHPGSILDRLLGTKRETKTNG